MLIAVLLPFASMLAAQQSSADCKDDRGTDRCASAVQSRMRAMYGLPSIEDHARRGDEVRRVFYVDGYGRDLIAISFVRAPGRDPAAFIHFPRRIGERGTPALQAPVPHRIWGDVLQRSGLFDREMLPRATDKQELNVCLHAWLFLAETNDPARADGGDALVRRKVEDACQDGPVGAFATELQQMALPLFPHCDRLDPSQYRNAAAQLSACRLLSGDRVAAAEVMNRTDALRGFRSPSDREQIAGLFGHSVRIDWAGEQRELGMIPAGQYWADKLRAVGGANFYLEKVEGQSADKVRLTAAFSRIEDPPGEGRSIHHRAPVQLTWQFGPSQQWEIVAVTVGAWKRREP
jgi:hypothetical protein